MRTRYCVVEYHTTVQSMRFIICNGCELSRFTSENVENFNILNLQVIYLNSETVCATYCHTSAEEPCKTAEQAELRKIHKYRHLTDFHFIPIGAETLGPFGPHAVKFLEDLGNKISQINGERRSKSFLFQSIGIAIQRGNASCVMGTTGSMGKLEELNYL